MHSRNRLREAVTLQMQDVKAGSRLQELAGSLVKMATEVSTGLPVFCDIEEKDMGA
jgi:hypothetical protein